MYRSPHLKIGIGQGVNITQVEAPADRSAKEWMRVPALALPGLIVTLQRGRSRREQKPAGVARAA